MWTSSILIASALHTSTQLKHPKHFSGAVTVGIVSGASWANTFVGQMMVHSGHLTHDSSSI